MEAEFQRVGEPVIYAIFSTILYEQLQCVDMSQPWCAFVNVIACMTPAARLALLCRCWRAASMHQQPVGRAAYLARGQVAAAQMNAGLGIRTVGGCARCTKTWL